MAGFVKSQWKPQLLHGLLLRGVPHLLDKPRVQKGEPRQLARLSGQRIRFHIPSTGESRCSCSGVRI